MKKYLFVFFMILISTNSFASGTHADGDVYGDPYTIEDENGNWRFSGALTFGEQSANPATPTSTDLIVFTKDKSGVPTLYTRDPFGTVMEIGTGGISTQIGVLVGNGSSVTGVSTSAGISSAISDETGGLKLVFSDAPTFTTSITAPLIYGGSGVTSNINFQSTSATGTTDYIKFTVGDHGGTEAMRILDNGNVGIGTAVPGARFEVGNGGSGTFVMTGTGSISGNVGVGTTSVSLSALNIGSGTPTAATSGLNFGTDTASNWYRSTASTVKTDGNLVVSGHDTFEGITSTGATGTGKIVFDTQATFTTSITNPLMIGGTAAGSTLELRSTGGTGSGDFIKFTRGTNGGTELMRLVGNNVGIGSTAPAALLDIGGATIMNGNLTFNSGQISLNSGGVLVQNTGLISSSGVTTGANYQSVNNSLTTGQCFFGTSSSAAMTGSIVRGTYSGTNSGNVAFFDSTNASATGTVLKVTNVGTGPIATFTGGSGNVGIGSLTPTQALDLAGTMTTTSQIFSSATGTLGWSVKTGANTACSSTCTSACVFGEDTSVVGTIVSCTDATADVCLCAGSS